MRSRHHRWEEQLAQFNLNLTYREGASTLYRTPSPGARTTSRKPPTNQPVLAAVSCLIPDRAFLTDVRLATTADPYAQMAVSRMILADTAFASFSLKTMGYYITPAACTSLLYLNSVHAYSVLTTTVTSLPI